ncbi:bifunctional nuclease family protein [Barnesiella sp. WM24]|uniref:bifunctional nuclease family protein n=1 Tax=Barnesiella sp. WM24 TaxID=2558278 RepID=UPI000ABCBFBB|nr:bifunctional nuclease family protein [Barnesiella sp. WM24]TFU92898.1 bifunctional nuclease family protein [Barnesiella sp. WM24]
MTNERIRLRVLGISYSQIQTGAYALILAQVDGPYRIPIIIGASEAQSIAIRLESIIPPRPMTHDLFVSFAHAFGVKLKEVFIYKFEDGIFSSEITFADQDRTIVLDARTSDAIAIAIRTKAPIYTTKAILDETGFILEESPEDDADDDSTTRIIAAEDDTTQEPKLENYAIEELERTLERLIEQENYEEAAKVSEILKRKRNETH